MMKIKNTAGTGEGELTYLPIFNCSTNSPSCTVEVVEAQGLPWPPHLVTVSSANYVVIEDVEVDLEYGGVSCVLSGFQIPITGTAGGHYENGSETIVFNAASFTATGTELRALGSKIEWTGVFSAEAFGPHLGQSLTI